MLITVVNLFVVTPLQKSRTRRLTKTTVLQPDCSLTYTPTIKHETLLGTCSNVAGAFLGHQFVITKLKARAATTNLLLCFMFWWLCYAPL